MDLVRLQPLQHRLEHHPVYAAVRDLPALRRFMEHHVFSVWDFMSLLKALQQHAAPSTTPWLSAGNGDVQRFINEIVLEEESDEATGADGQTRYLSHFEMYLEAMGEIEADTAPIREFLENVKTDGITPSLHNGRGSEVTVEFMWSTFAVIEEGKEHCIAAAFSLGREDVVPRMFRSLLREMHITENEAPMFHYYLNRHVALDELEHGPMALAMLDALCEGDTAKQVEAMDAAENALRARIKFWDAVHAAL